jgi:hypothetical protein
LAFEQVEEGNYFLTPQPVGDTNFFFSFTKPGKNLISGVAGEKQFSLF